MEFNSKLEQVRFLRRYKRFLVDVERECGDVITVHCPNTGRMTNCMVEGSPAWILDSQNDKRKYRFGLELVTTSTGDLACVNTQRANQLVLEALHAGKITELLEYRHILTEQVYGDEGSRIDFLLTAARGDESSKPCYVEVKSVTLGEAFGVGYFPDAPSTRGQKHLRELMAMSEQGCRAVLLFCVQHTGILGVSPADHIDEVYGRLMRQAVAEGVEVLAYRSAISLDQMVLSEPLIVKL